MSDENVPINLDDDVEVLNLTLAELQHAIALSIREIRKLKRRVDELETAKVVQQGLIDSHQHKIDLLEHMLKGGTVQ